VRSLSALILALTASACLGPPYDAELRSGLPTSPREPPTAAPVFRYELAVVAPGEQVRLGDPEAFSDRVGVTVDDLLRGRGVSPERSDASVREPHVRLTLIHGSARTELRAESGDLRKTYSAPAAPPRQSLDLLLGRMLADFLR